MRATARYYDGETAEARDVTLTLTGHQLYFELDGRTVWIEANGIRLISPVGRAPWVIEADGGASLHIADDDFGTSLAGLHGQRSFVRKLESAWSLALLAVVVALLGMWSLLTWGVPYGAHKLAFALPEDIMTTLGDDSMEVLDEVAFSPTELPEDRRRHVRALFGDIVAHDPVMSRYRLEFRSSKVGPNAFAVPGGIVVMTDQLVQLAEADDEIIAVLAHEVGHLYHRHSLRILLQNSATVMIVAMITGDVSAVTSLSATIPTVLMQAKYSRDFEREADDFAFDYLDANELSSDALLRLLQRIEGSDHGDDDGITTWFSTHPPTSERVDDD